MDEAIENRNPWNNRGGDAASGNLTPKRLPTPTRPIALWFSWSLLSLPTFLNPTAEPIVSSSLSETLTC
jgi:hypothetical protein